MVRVEATSAHALLLFPLFLFNAARCSLPKIFVLETLSEYSTKVLESCPMEKYGNAGYGRKMDIGIQTSSYETHNTGQFSLDVILYQKFIQHSGRVQDVQKADFIFVPFFFQPILHFQSQQHCKSTNSIVFGNKKPLRITRKVLNTVILPEFLHSLLALLRHMKATKQTVLMSLSRTPGNNYKESFFSGEFRESLQNFLFVGIENWENKYSNVLMAPYPAIFHLRGKDPPTISFANRTTFVYFGSPRTKMHSARKAPTSKTLRQAIVNELLLEKRVSKEILLQGTFSKMNAYTAMERSVFCIHPPGDSPTRRAFYDSILLGCIPVIFSGRAYTPFGWTSSGLAIHLDATPRPLGIVSALLKVPVVDIQSIQSNMLRAMQSLQYSFLQDEESDAFGFLLRAIQQRNCPSCS